ncbi:hypothetical protein ABXT21_25045 [Ralstonia sp. SM1864_UCD524_TZ4]|uniref:DUF6933 domain-containing protein n=1 Tax=Ralstonia solanacearum TaxID=305 RepID=A0A0S4VT16_RALSL|nr:hypothetical protein [Ralstonia pseudosolanacearum]CUV26552.1 conserved protein of unknown function [Ralstonia solanacearum]CUV37563.1 conserved protein of unknown function [Ralstonia solanacearum]CUV42110.1 conserved protein of unknown function [Ralstonia solanacearum]CUV64151.1 conserved protein of unknown function [Ralstonia solanacearum]
MFRLHCTRKLLDRLNRKPIDETGFPSTSALGNWYATALFWRPQVALFVNERTLLPVLMPLAPVITLTTRFPAALAAALQSHGWSDAQIAAEMQHMRECEIDKTANRSVIGMLNEFTFLAQAWREQHGPLDLQALSMRLADVPCGPLHYGSPAQLVQTIARN